jgi:hypothetical protein
MRDLFHLSSYGLVIIGKDFLISSVKDTIVRSNNITSKSDYHKKKKNIL